MVSHHDSLDSNQSQSSSRRVSWRTKTDGFGAGAPGVQFRFFGGSEWMTFFRVFRVQRHTFVVGVFDRCFSQEKR